MPNRKLSVPPAPESGPRVIDYRNSEPVLAFCPVCDGSHSDAADMVRCECRAVGAPWRVGDDASWFECGLEVRGYVRNVLGAYLVVRGPDGWDRRINAKRVSRVEASS